MDADVHSVPPPPGPFMREIGSDLPETDGGFVCIIMSMRDYKTMHIEKCKNMKKFMRWLYTTEIDTELKKMAPYLLVTYIVGFTGITDESDHINRKLRNKLQQSLKLARAQNMVASNKDFMNHIVPQTVTAFQLQFHEQKEPLRIINVISFENPPQNLEEPHALSSEEECNATPSFSIRSPQRYEDLPSEANLLPEKPMLVSEESFESVGERNDETTSLALRSPQRSCDVPSQSASISEENSETPSVSISSPKRPPAWGSGESYLRLHSLMFPDKAAPNIDETAEIPQLSLRSPFKSLDVLNTMCVFAAAEFTWKKQKPKSKGNANSELNRDTTNQQPSTAEGSTVQLGAIESEPVRYTQIVNFKGKSCHANKGKSLPKRKTKGSEQPMALMPKIPTFEEFVKITQQQQDKGYEEMSAEKKKEQQIEHGAGPSGLQRGKVLPLDAAALTILKRDYKNYKKSLKAGSTHSSSDSD